MSLRRAGLIGCLIGAWSCAPGVRSAAPPRASAEQERAVVTEHEEEAQPSAPPEGVVSGVDVTHTSTEGFVSDPLVKPWLAAEDVISPIFVTTGTITFDLPMSEHPLVDEWVEFLKSRGRKWFRTWLARSTRYVPLFYEVLDRYGLPRDLVFLAMVESGFSPFAFSWASAAGPWQFMPRTARRYGLRVGFWVDERRDFERSTEAAARHLTWLYTLFEDWHLAMAAYNAGAGRMRSVLRRSGVEDFWSLQDTRRVRRETKQYVPKILASARIAKDPENHGFREIPYQPPLGYSTLTVTVATSLATIGEACGGLPADALEELNPALRVSVTPPGEAWPVRVPPRLVDACADGLASLPMETRMTFRYHEAEIDEPVSRIARAYGTTVDAILQFHGEKDEARMLDYAEIAVPIPAVRAQQIPRVVPPEERQRGSYAPGEVRLLRYRISAGDSLWKVARRFRVSMKSLRAWNGLWGTNHLRLGQSLRVYLKPGRRIREHERRPQMLEALAGSGQHRVAEGESLWVVAKKYGTSVERLRALNDLLPGQVLSIGQILRVKGAGAAEASR